MDISWLKYAYHQQGRLFIYYLQYSKSNSFNFLIIFDALPQTDFFTTELTFSPCLRICEKKLFLAPAGCSIPVGLFNLNLT